MNPAVRTAFPAFSERFEGKIAWMYLDILGLVTTGIGNLIDPIALALPLPWQWRPGMPVSGPADQNDIAQEWRRIKARADLAKKGAKAAGRVATLELSPAAIDALVLGKLDDNERVLKKRFPALNDWPADAQLAVFSMAWALGPWFYRTWPKFSAACDRMDWAAAAGHSHIPDARNPGLVPRNAENKRLLLAAASSP